MVCGRCERELKRRKRVLITASQIKSGFHMVFLHPCYFGEACLGKDSLQNLCKQPPARMLMRVILPHVLLGDVRGVPLVEMGRTVWPWQDDLPEPWNALDVGGETM